MKVRHDFLAGLAYDIRTWNLAFRLFGLHDPTPACPKHPKRALLSVASTSKVPVRCGNMREHLYNPTSVSIDKWGFLLNPLRSRQLSRTFPGLSRSCSTLPRDRQATKLPPGHSGEWQGDHRGHPVQPESAQPKFSHPWGASC